jgi:flagellar biosynthesis protein FlhG
MDARESRYSSHRAVRSSTRTDQLNLPITPIIQQRFKSWSLGLPSQCDPSVGPLPAIIAIGGGKGGVGKSLLTANIAASLAKAGFTVTAFDLDCGGANLHTYFGVSSSVGCLGDAIVHGRVGLGELMTPTSIAGLTLVSSSKDDAWTTSDVLSGVGLSRLWQGLVDLRKRGVQIVLWDLGAGTQRHTIDLFCCAHAGIITALPEPTSIENAYLFIRTAMMRLLDHATQRVGLGEQAQEVMGFIQNEHPNARTYTDKMRLLYQSSPGTMGPLLSTLSARTMGICMNQVRSQGDIDIGAAVELAANRYFGFASKYIGYLNYDDVAWKALRNRRLMSLDFPHAGITRKIQELSLTILKELGF